MKQNGSTVVVLGILGSLPVAGVAWQILQHLEGLRRLGYDVHYFEETLMWPLHPDQPTPEAGIRNTVDFIGQMMKRVGMEERWAYRAPMTGLPLYGLSETARKDVLKRAAAVVNVTASQALIDEYLDVPVRIYLETDPVKPQIEIAQGHQFTIDLLAAHTHHFTYGENFGAVDCGVPVERFDYRPTRPPVILDWWAGRGGEARAYTTIASWSQPAKDIHFNGEVYRWSKHHEFLKFLDLPGQRELEFELALSGADEKARAMLHDHGWKTISAVGLSEDIEQYRQFIVNSRGEFTVAKDQNIRLRSGWFSDRSATYLGAGRPVITQDTGFGNVLPTGKGLFAFNTMEDIVGALDAIESDYAGHCRAAEEIAQTYFRAETVLGDLMRSAGV